MEAITNWLLHASLPLWLARGIDRAAGAFHEELAADTYICSATFRRLRVAARQTYVFSRAHMAGVAGADEAASLGVDFLLRRAALPDGGFASRFDLANRPIDQTRDLYDHAFVLLAFAAASHVMPATALRAEALKLITFIIQAFAHAEGGFHETLPPSLPRRQNPHMHLLEACLAAHRAFGEPVFLESARDLISLLLTRFHHAESGALLEFFADDWKPKPPGALHPIEPGHCCEWVWLLHDYQAATVRDPALVGVSAALVDFVDRHGVHPATGDLIDCVAQDGTKLALSARLWPQTERLKAAALRPDATPALKQAAAACLANRLHPDGLWTERRTATGADIAGSAPASSLYHLACAILLPAAG